MKEKTEGKEETSSSSSSSVDLDESILLLSESPLTNDLSITSSATDLGSSENSGAEVAITAFFFMISSLSQLGTEG